VQLGGGEAAPDERLRDAPAEGMEQQLGERGHDVRFQIW
jgi:hypothetical protein